jgi:hypothetical protein
MKGPLIEAGKDVSKRRSQRLLLQVAVIVRSEGDSGSFKEETHTLVVNAHGALVALATAVENTQTLFVKNKITGEEMACRIAYLGSPSEGKSQVGLEFLQPAPTFWHITFPPEDWGATGASKGGR